MEISGKLIIKNQINIKKKLQLKETPYNNNNNNNNSNMSNKQLKDNWARQIQITNTNTNTIISNVPETSEFNPIITGTSGKNLNHKNNKNNLNYNHNNNNNNNNTTPIPTPPTTTNNNQNNQNNSGSGWIQAFRSQSRGQEVTIPCVRIENNLTSNTNDDNILTNDNNSLDGMERIEITDSTVELFHEQNKGNLSIPNKHEYLQNNHNHNHNNSNNNNNSNQNSSNQNYIVPSDEDTLSATSVKLVQDYIDLSSAITPKTPVLTTRHVTLVKKNNIYYQNDLDLYTNNEPENNSKETNVIKSHYSGMDKDDTISLVAPKYRIPISEISTVSNQQQSLLSDPAPSLSITSIPSPRSQYYGHRSNSIQNHRKFTPSNNNHNSYSNSNSSEIKTVSISNSLVGIGGEVLERDDLFLPDQNTMNRSSILTNDDSQFMTITGTSIAIPTSSLTLNKSPQKYSNHINDRNQHNNYHNSNNSNNNNNGHQRSSIGKNREIVNMQHIPLPCTNFDFTDSTQSLYRKDGNRSSSPSHVSLNNSISSIGVLATSSIHNHNHNHNHNIRSNSPTYSQTQQQLQLHLQQLQQKQLQEQHQLQEQQQLQEGLIQNSITSTSTNNNNNNNNKINSTSIREESMMTTFVTENTKYILNQYLVGTPPIIKSSPISRPSTQTQFLSPRVVTPRLEVEWQKKFNKQQQKLRQIFQSSMESKSKQWTPQIPPTNKKTKQSLSRINRIQTQMTPNLEINNSLNSNSTQNNNHTTIYKQDPNYPENNIDNEEDDEEFQYLNLQNEDQENENQNEIEKYGYDQGNEENEDIKSEIQSVLNEMSRTEMGYDIKPLERYSNQIPIEDFLMNLENIQHQTSSTQILSSNTISNNGNSVTRLQLNVINVNNNVNNNSNSNSNTSNSNNVNISSTVSNYTPRLLLGSARKTNLTQSIDNHTLPPVPHSISLPTVNGIQSNSIDTIPLNSLSATPSIISSHAVDILEAKKTMSRRILHIHNNPNNNNNNNNKRRPVSQHPSR